MCSSDVLANVLTYPHRDQRRNFARVEFGRVDPVGPPQLLLIHGSQRALPLHFLPTTLPDHVKAMPWVRDVVPHPRGKCNVVWYEGRIVPTLREAKTLRVFRSIEQAHSDALQLVG